MALVSPLIAVGADGPVCAALIFAAAGQGSARGALRLFRRAADAGLVAAGTGRQGDAAGADRRSGLSLCYLSNNWNIGAEGQYVIGGDLRRRGRARLPGRRRPSLAVPAMVLAGMAGGALWAAIPALAQGALRTSEILTSLMLVYVAELILDYLVRGPWRDPAGFNFPQTVTFDNTMPILVEGSRIHLGAAFAALAVRGGRDLLLGRSLKGFEIKVLGQAPRAGLFAGFSPGRMTLFVFLVSGALAGLAGHLRGRRLDGPAAALDLARLRLHRHHRRLSRHGSIRSAS